MNIVERIVSNNFVASETDVQQLAQQVVAGRTADSTYLKVLVVAVQQAMAARRRGSAINIFETTAERLYQVVRSAVGDENTPAIEINRRATFARTSAHALRKFIKMGGDVKTIDPFTVTKRSLAPTRPKPAGGDRVERSIQLHAEALIATAQKVEAKDPKRAAEILEDLIERFQAELDQLEGEHEAQPTARVVIPRGRPERSVPAHH